MHQKYSHARRMLSFMLVLVMVLTMLPASVFSVEDTITLYFRNDWMWTDIRAYYWTGSGNNSWPGEAMTFVENNGTYDIYSIEIPASAIGIIFNGINDKSVRDKSPDITDFADGDAFYMHWADENKCSKFDYTPPASGGGEVGTGEPCTVTLHFGNTDGWSNVYLYSWISGGNTLLGGWPGTPLTQGNDGFYSCSFEVPSGSAVNFIYSNGSGSQTVDLNLGTVSSNVEKWVKLSGQDTEGKYYASQLTSAYTIAISPQVNGKNVTFEYVGDATSVAVAGNFNGWSETANAMTKSGEKWSVTVPVSDFGQYEYKFFINGTDWITDPVNGWKISYENGNQNSAFFIADPSAVDENEITVNITYVRSDNTYTNWNVYAWGADGLDNPYNFDANHKTSIVLDGRDNLSLTFKVRKSVGNNDWAEQSGEVHVDLSKVVSGTVDVTVYYNGESYSSSQSLGSDVVMDNKLSSVELDYEHNTINVNAVQAIANPSTELTLVRDGQTVSATVTASGAYYVVSPSVALELVNLHEYTIRFDGYTYAIGTSNIYATDKFAAEYTYGGNDLGASWSAGSTTFKVWAPTASAVSVKLYATGSDDAAKEQKTPAVLGTHSMTAGENGVWYVTVSGDLNGVYYTYLVTRGGQTVEAVDPYARTTGVNGQRGMVINLDSTDPTGWENDENPNPSTSYTDAIIYELHVRDFSIDDSSGIIEDYQGKFLAFTQGGSTVPGTDISTGIDYLKSLGVTHIHLLPVYDYGSVDETLCDSFNWGYDPVNYNVPEGSYSTDPYRAELRVSQFKQMVMALHDAGISVIMDVVYNHVYDADKFCFNQIVPGYFSRPNSNTSGCGNDTASEREMVSKYIVESVTYWCEEYHIDGFRFDLVGLIDVDTINAIVDSVHDGLGREDVIFYGEGWDMDSTNKEAGTDMAKQGNADKTPGFAYFSDSIRNQLAGSNGSSKGFVSGGGVGNLAAYYLARPESWGATWTKNPQQIIQYASCHDNYTLIDKLVISTGASGITDDIISMNNLAAAIYMTSAGVPFIHAGEEMLREKLEEDGGRCENSYNAPDSVNKIRWDKLKSTTHDYAGNVEYYKGLIEFRKAHAALRYDTAWEVQKYMKAIQVSDSLMVFHIDGYGADDQDIYIIFNASTTSQSVALPEGDWTVNIDKDNAGTASLGTYSGTVTVEGISAMILTQRDSGENESGETVTLYFTNNKGWEQVYAYAWVDGEHYPLGPFPGAPMTYIGTNDYGQDIYAITTSADVVKVLFNNNNGTQTVDLDVIPGKGYYCEDTTDASGHYECGTYDYAGTSGSSDDFYLFGYINGANYGCEEDYANLGAYLFENGTVTATFSTDSYVGVKTGDNGTWYMTNGWLGYSTCANLYDSNALTNADKLLVPGGVEITFTLVQNKDGSLTLSYTADLSSGFYDDKSGIQDGVTLHCWNWSFSEIEANMDKIAEMGFTAIQTSPVQPLKEATTGKPFGGNWWVYYQPVNFTITTADGNALGTKTELKSMIEAAHSRGIQVIVDVVANHLGNETGNDLSPAIPAWLRNNNAYWHSITTNISDYTNRQDVTQNCMGGLPDLNTGNDDIQNAVLAFLHECVDVGVDGFRFDAAKHIETPEDGVFASDFWPIVIGGVSDYADATYGKDLYFYGEVLDSTDGFSISDYTEYMSVTDNVWGNTLRESISSGNAALSGGYYKAADPSNLVIWAESHDTYANDDGASKDETVAKINLTWALVAARADAMGLYLSRPTSNSQMLGTASTIGWYTKEVKAVNEFHNDFVGHSETLGNSGNISYVVRSNCGIVMVNAKGTTASVQFSVPMADGIYRDKISGNTFTVENGKIVGQIGTSGIAVIYTDEVAAIGSTTFDSVQAAIDAAVEGDTIVLLRSASTTAVELLEGVTLDLNGYDLIVHSHVAAFSGNAVIDSAGGGLLKVGKDRVMLQKDNGYLPIWNGNNGYAFASCKRLNSKEINKTDDSVTFKFLATLGADAYALLAAGAETSGVTMKVEVSWARASGPAGSTIFTYTDALLAGFYDTYNPETGKFGGAFTLGLNGISGKTLSYKVYFESDTGVLLECE